MNHLFVISCLLAFSTQITAQETGIYLNESICSKIYTEPGTEITKLYSSEGDESDDLTFFETYQGDTLILAWQVDGNMTQFRLQGLSDLISSYSTVDSIYLYDITQDGEAEAFVFYNSTMSRDGWSSGWYESFDYLGVWELSTLKLIGESEIELGLNYDTWELAALPPEDLTEQEFDYYMDTVSYSYDSLQYTCKIAFASNYFEIATKLEYDSYGDESETSNFIRFQYENGTLKED
ncbi:MAG: hypothetical protein ACPGED_12075 [Flavobacteriales bacterium]